MEAKRVLCVAGPTACGKTAMGVALAKRYNGEVVSVDSMQIYKGMTIGTAAPTAEETAGIPHHMVGVADPAESWSAARFVEQADRCVEDILARGRLPVLVGGTGLYLEALIAGRTFAPGEAGGAIRTALERELTFQNGVNSALVTTILDKIVVKKSSIKEEIHLDIHLKFGGPWEAVFNREHPSLCFTRPKNTTPKAPTRRT